MTLPPGLQAVRDRADWLKECEDRTAAGDRYAEDVPALLDLIETLAEALEAVTTFPGVRERFAPEDSLGSIWAQVRAALDKYRRFK